MANVNFLPNDFETTRQSLIDAFKNDNRYFFKQYFNNYSEGSTLSYIIDIFAYINTYFNYMTNVSANEPFITVAQLDKNIFGSAKSLGYVPHRTVASKIEYRVELPTTYNRDSLKNYTLSIPLFTQFRSKEGKTFSLMEQIDFVYVDGTYIKEGNENRYGFRNYIIDENQNIVFDCSEDEEKELNEIAQNCIFRPIYYTFKQGYYIINTYKSNGEANQQFSINRTDIDDSKSSLIVTSPTSNEWKELTSILDFSVLKNNSIVDGSYSLISGLKDEQIYILNTNSDGLQITFGDGFIGKIPEAGDVIFIKLFTTSGIDGNANTDLVSTSTNTFSAIEETSGTSATISFNFKDLILTPKDEYKNGSIGGADKQSAESVRKIAPYIVQSQGRIVNDIDFESYIKGQDEIPVTDCKVISGENYNPPFLGGVAVIVAKEGVSDDILQGTSYYLTDYEKYVLKNNIEGKCIMGNDCLKFVDPEFIFVDVSGLVFYHRVYSESDVSNIFNSFTDSYFASINQFGSYYKFSQYVTTLVNQTEIDHVSLKTDMFMVKRISRSDLEDVVNITIGNKIQQGSVNTMFSVANNKLRFLNNNGAINDSEEDMSINYLKVINVNEVNGSNQSGSERFSFQENGKTYYPKYYCYSIYDEVDENDSNKYNLYLQEDVYIFTDDSDYCTIEKSLMKRTVIGKVDYIAGKIYLNIGNYESLADYVHFRVYDIIDNSESESEYNDGSILPTLVDVLFFEERESDTKLKFYEHVYFALNFKLTDSENFLSSGQTMIKKMNSDVKYIAS